MVRLSLCIRLDAPEKMEKGKKKKRTNCGGCRRGFCLLLAHVFFGCCPYWTEALVEIPSGDDVEKYGGMNNLVAQYIIE